MLPKLRSAVIQNEFEPCQRWHYKEPVMSTPRLRMCYCLGVIASLLLIVYCQMTDNSWSELPWEGGYFLIFAILVYMIQEHLPAYLPSNPYSHVMVRQFQLAALLVGLYVVIPHCYMSVKLADLHREFRAVAEKGPHSLPYLSEGGLIEYSTKNIGFDGALDRIVHKRDERLARYHFRQVQQGWFWNHPNQAAFQSFYLWTPWQ